MCNQALRQLLCIEDSFSRQVRQRNFRRRNQIKRCFAFCLEEVFFELWQLTGSRQRIRLHEVGNVRFFIAVFARVHVQHKLDERPMQPGQRTPHHYKPRSGNAACRVEIEHAESRAQVHVVFWIKIERRNISPAPNFLILRFVVARRHIIVKQVRQAKFYCLQCLPHFTQPCFACVETIAEILDRRE